MRRIGLIGDTQGRYRVPALLAAVGPHFEEVDEIWHAGDWQEPAVLEGLRALGRPLTAVNGNAPDDPSFPERVLRTIEGLEVGMVHRPPRAGDRWAAGCDIVVHGHTHRLRDETVAGTRFINVSSATAAGFSGDRTIGVLSIAGGAAELRVIGL
ncbi:MAG: metallophosphoesterase family protein [Candidatus Dormibacteraceae bacterium]